ncbi:MAG: lysophospholipid acyltransferase family protein, partial [Flavobacterium sp.]|nr:lysophospholipid acyltransferase family protein [Flavobacterium sp.]
MQFIAFILTYPLLWIISVLPFRLLYFLSDTIFLLVYYIIGYRKITVRKNLSIALPHLNEKELLQIEKKFYHHLCDVFLEMIKTLTISEKEMNKRFICKNLSDLRALESKGKSIAVLTSHYASYEWSISMNKNLGFEGFAIYKKIANRYFDKLVRDIRSKFGATLITTKETISTIEKNYRKGHLGIYGFASDQSPKSSKAHHWGTFFGVTTPFQTGAEMLSKRFDMTVLL